MTSSQVQTHHLIDLCTGGTGRSKSYIKTSVFSSSKRYTSLVGDSRLYYISNQKLGRVMKKRVYLDYAATAPLLPQVKRMLCADSAPDYENSALAYKGKALALANASSLHTEGRRARQALECAREELAAAIGCAPPELSFCSGGTEAAGTLIEGIARGAQEHGAKLQKRHHVVCAAFEHHAVRESALSLKRLGFEVSFLNPTRTGHIRPESLAATLRSDTLMVICMLAQNEVGTIQDIAALAELAHEHGTLFVCDCVQALGKMSFSVADLKIDAACFSAHKIGGPYGIGAFYLKTLTPFLPRQLGGGQEHTLRSGTQNVPAALAFALAAKLHTSEYINKESLRLAALRDDLISSLTQNSRRIRSTVSIKPGDTKNHLPQYAHVLIEGIESQTMVLKLDELGFAVSGGSACSSGSLEPSHVLTSMGISKNDAFGALRISMGRNTSSEDCLLFAEALLSIL